MDFNTVNSVGRAALIALGGFTVATIMVATMLLVAVLSVWGVLGGVTIAAGGFVFLRGGVVENGEGASQPPC